MPAGQTLWRSSLLGKYILCLVVMRLIPPVCRLSLYHAWLVCGLLGLPVAVQAQLFGNEWIDFDKTYFKIAVSEDGIQRLSGPDLLAAGFPTTVRAEHVQLFFRGRECAIWVEDNGDGRVTDANDFIAFYGRRNDGSFDRQMYANPDWQTNPYESVYDDRTYFFLTFTTNGNLGRRMQVLEDVDPTAPTAPYHFEEAVVSGTDQWAGGRVYNFGSSDTRGSIYAEFNEGKGLSSSPLGGNGRRDLNLPVRDFVSAGPAPVLRARFVGRINATHRVTLSAGRTVGQQRVLDVLDFLNSQTVTSTRTLTAQDLPTTNANLVVSWQLTQLAANRPSLVSLGFATLTYPQQLTWAGSDMRRIFRVTAQGTFSRLRLNIANTPITARAYDVTDLADVRRFAAVSTSTGMSLLANDMTAADRREIAVETSFRSPSIRPITFTRIQPSGMDYLIVSHSSLMRPAAGTANAVESYAQYRSSAAGGGHQVLVADVDNLYNQFAQGQHHPLAIRRFVEFCFRNGSPRYLLLVGKALDLTYFYGRQLPESENWAFRDLVPSFGKPASDHSFSEGLAGQPYVPALATGRLAATTPAQVMAYLNKVRQYEQTPYNDLWRKRALHISGGITTDEHRAYRSNIENYKTIYEGLYFGGRAELYSKTSTDEVEFVDVVEEINDGLGILTFFGHSASNSTDVTIGYASDELLGYRNSGRYPLMLLNGCNAGNIFGQAVSLGEDWTLTPDKGAILYLAHADLGWSDVLNNFSTSFYRQMFADTTIVHKPFGQAYREMLQRFLLQFPGDPRAQINAQQTLLQGDPALIWFGAQKPDFYLADERVSPHPIAPDTRITARSTQFRIQIVPSNFGRAVRDSFTIAVRRTFADGTIKWYPSRRYPSTLFQDTLQYILNTTLEDRERAAGINEFDIFLDEPNRIAELNENNNSGRFQLFFPRGSMICVTPQEFSIANRQPVELIGFNTDVETPQRQYRFQLDTTDFFSSPAFRERVVTAGSTPVWSTSLLTDNNVDSLVYYWRVRLANPLPEEDTVWATSSFLYIKDEPQGWSQSHFPQFKKNTLERIVRSDAGRQWHYANQDVVIKAQALGGNLPNWTDHFIEVNGVKYVSDGNCFKDRAILVRFDRNTGQTLTTIYRDYACGLGTPGFATSVPESWLYTLNSMNAFLNACNPGDWVLFMTSGTVNFRSLSAGNIAGFERIGIRRDNLARVLKNGDPYIAFGRIGDLPNSALEILPDTLSPVSTQNQTIFGEFRIRLDFAKGTITSPRIGPAREWGNVFRHFVGKDTPFDDFRVELLGIDRQGNTSTLLDRVALDGQNINFIDANSYPYLQLRAHIDDTVRKTPLQLDKWQVIYAYAPEGILYFDSTTTNLTAAPIVEDGQPTKFFFKFKNVTPQAFTDTLTVQYTIRSATTNRSQTFTRRLRRLPGYDSLRFELPIDTRGWAGQNYLNVYVNPRLLAEQLYENNILETRFTVLPDITHPVLEVAFDGQQIMNGDIVSPTPLITVNLKDEHRFLIKNDTLNMSLFLKRCETCPFERISLADPRIQWGQTGQNNFQITYRPDRLNDGKYTFVAQGADVSGNISGVKPYRIDFQVVNESRITHFYPYPNPFSSSVRFVFTLTGSDLPDELKIQIMTVTGKVVREILQEEIGPIRIGNNITSYAWDGRDEYGGELGNGVYLYRVVARKNGQNIERRGTAGDHLFEQEFGKLYLLR